MAHTLVSYMASHARGVPYHAIKAVALPYPGRARVPRRFADFVYRASTI